MEFSEKPTLSSIKFPDMFTLTTTNLSTDHEATLQNLKLVIMSVKTSLFGDPYFGTELKRQFFEQNSPIIRDLIVDDIYMAIVDFMPQIEINRKNIEVYSEFKSVYVKISCINKLDYTIDTLNIKLIDDE